MCPPAYYNIKYEINPWMNIHRSADTSAAQRQWENLYNILKDNLKIDIELIEPDPKLPDMVFTANAGLVKDKKFICSNFRYKQRQPERDLFSEWFMKNGYEVIGLPKRYYFEGEGDALFLGDTVFAGYRYRSDIHTHRYIAKIFDMRVISVELTDSYFYHLDTCFCPLADNTVFYYPYAFDSYANTAIKNLIPNRIRVRKKEAVTFCCNAIVYGNKIVMNRGADILKHRLEELGFSVYQIELSEFIKAGGSAKCMIMWI